MALVVAGATACGGGSDGGADAAVDAPVVSTPTPPAPPEAPAPATLTPCPMGWREIAPAGPDEVATCDPWPVGGPLDCPSIDEAHFPGEPGCSRIGTACPAGEWADDLPAGAT